MWDAVIIPGVCSTVMAQTPRSLGWQLGMSAYWFATSMKWFVMLITLAFVVNELVPGGSEGRSWGFVVLVGGSWAMIGPGLFGYLSDRTRGKWGRWKPYLAIGCAGTCLALMFLANAKSYSVVIVGYLLLQISDDLATGPYSMLIPSLVPEEQRGRASGIMGLMQFSAQLVAGVVSIVIGSIVPIYATVAGVSVACALITLMTVKEEPAERVSDRVGFVEGWITPWRDHDFKWAWITRFLNALGFYLVITYLGLYFLNVVKEFTAFGVTFASVSGMTTASAAAQKAVIMVALLISTCAAIGTVIAGRAADKIGRKRVIYLCGTAMAIALVPFALFPNFQLIILLAVVFGLGYGAYESSNWALVSDVLPSQDDVAKDMGIWQSSIAAPQVVAGLLGLVVDIKDVHGVSGFGIVFICAAAAYFVSTFLVRMIRGSR